jgi:hypothetical protein
LLLKSETGNNSLWLEMFGYRFPDNDERLTEEDILSIVKKKRFSLAKSYNKLSIIRLVEYKF